MDRERYERACSFFVEAVELEDDVRADYLSVVAADDPELKAILVDMLEADRSATAAGEALADPERILSIAEAATDDADGSEGVPPLPERVGSYRILGLLGSGGMGVVYLAEQSSPRREVALKVIRSGSSSGDVARRFRREGQVHGLLSHRAIAQVYETGTASVEVSGSEAGEVAFIAMERIVGRTLDAWSQDRHGLEESIELVVEIADAVAHAHERGVVHRDLKPGNILIDEDGAAKVIDFGIARALSPDLDTLAQQTKVGQIIGTLSYMSPEQVSGVPDDVGIPSDVYSLGVVLYELLAGRLPYDVGSRSIAVAARVIQEVEPIRPSAIDLRLRGDLENIVLKALEKEPERRYESASALADDLRRHLADEPVRARPASTFYVLKKLAKRNPGVATMFAAVMLAIMAAAGIYRWKNADLEVQRSRLAQSLGREKSEKLRVQAAKERVQAEKDRVMRLKDRRVLREHLLRAAELFPSHPENIGALEQWLLEARELVDRLPIHRAALAEMEAAAGPYTEEQQAADHPGDRERLDELTARAALLEERLDEVETDAEEERLTGALESVESEMEVLEARLAKRSSWGFDAENAWLHELLVDLVKELENLGDEDGIVADVRDRLATAKEIGPRTLGDHADSWKAVRLRVLDNADYAGLDLPPQLGLVPLGPDPLSGLEEFLHWQSHERGAPVPGRDADGRLTPREETGIVFVLIPTGSFRMGAERPPSPEARGPNLDPYVSPPETPVVEVDVAAFFISKYEMTQGQWARTMAANPADVKPEQEWPTLTGWQKVTLLHPVEHVSWDDCREAMERLGLELPTEARWERAARAGTSSIWTCGDDRSALDRYENLADRFCKLNGGPVGWSYDEDLSDGRCCHAPIGTYLPNAFGLHDLGGNVAEWCGNRFYRYDPGDLMTDVAAGTYMIRGGSNSGTALDARVAGRVRQARSFRNFNVGCRAARSVVD